MNSYSTSNAEWSSAKKFLFRFVFVYFFLYCFPFPFDAFDLTKPIAQPYYDLLDWLIPRVGKTWFHTGAKAAFPMFDKMDDSYYGLVFLYFNLIISATAAFCWSIADRKRKN